MVTNDLDVYEATKIKPLGSKLGHGANATRAMSVDSAVAVLAIRTCSVEAVVLLSEPSKTLGVRQLLAGWRRGLVIQ
jgi:hypothetical protein